MRRTRKIILAAALALVAVLRPPDGALAAPNAAETRFLTGQLLVASAKIGDPRFQKSVIYMVDHDADGALGIIVNKVLGKGSVANLMKGFGIDPQGVTGSLALHFGGPVQSNAGFILHTSDYTAPRSRTVAGTIAFTTDVAILSAIGTSKGPRHLLFALGYAGWAAGQLEGEMQRGDWLVAPASEEMVFGTGRDAGQGEGQGAAQDDVWERLSGSAGLPL